MPKRVDLVLTISLTFLLALFVWRTLWLEAERDRLTAAHTSFVSYCRNAVALLAEQKRAGRCPQEHTGEFVTVTCCQGENCSPLIAKAEEESTVQQDKKETMPIFKQEPYQWYPLAPPEEFEAYETDAYRAWKEHQIKQFQKATPVPPED